MESNFYSDCRSKSKMQKEFTIGQAAKTSGVKVTTIRYYESVGLMPEPRRVESGRRIYGQAAVDLLGFIRHARDLGFTVDAIRDLIDLQENPGTDCAKADELARRHLVDTQTRIEQLRVLERELERMIDTCSGGEVGTCEIVTSLFDHSKCLADHKQKASKAS
ncbi:MAG: MerR family transcriptional regulator [Alphaproteobacteria bacterium]|nr:MerR family transcriptional regulator [Alphaproteobacteria bacterium]|tara:strand:+ start:187 stop:675 length:489 start_codon:yes stop_codon:yes gene_type:complete